MWKGPGSLMHALRPCAIPPLLHFFLKMLSIQSCQPFQAQEAVTAVQPGWGAGTGDGSALPSPGSCGMRTGMRVGRCPSPGSPTPALPLMPGIFGVGGYSSSYFSLSSRSRLRCHFLQEALWDSQPEVWSHLHPTFLLWVLTVLSFPFIHLPL